MELQESKNQQETDIYREQKDYIVSDNIQISPIFSSFSFHHSESELALSFQSGKRNIL